MVGDVWLYVSSSFQPTAQSFERAVQARPGAQGVLYLPGGAGSQSPALGAETVVYCLTKAVGTTSTIAVVVAQPGGLCLTYRTQRGCIITMCIVSNRDSFMYGLF